MRFNYHLIVLKRQLAALGLKFVVVVVVATSADVLKISRRVKFKCRKYLFATVT